MLKTFRALLALPFLVVLASTAAQAALPVAVDGQQLPSLAPLLEQVTPSVVNVYTQTRVRVRSPLMDDPFFRRFFNVPDSAREKVSQSLGSGVIVDAEEGYVLTNHHVIAGADDISVILSDGRRFSGELIGTDPDTDLAMIRIPSEHLQALPLADSKVLRVGDFVVAVGNPFGLGQTVTSGIVSALGRNAFSGLEFQNFIQTDASINPGNSGGALINLRGELVGINSAIFTPSGGNVGIGFAIPSAMAQSVMLQLAEHGEVRRGTLGIFVQNLTPELAGAFGLEQGSGVLVAEVAAKSSADKAGLEAGDVILAIAGDSVESAQEFHNYEGFYPVDEKVEIEFLREGKEKNARLTVQALPRLEGGDLNFRLQGAVFEEIPMKLRSQQVQGAMLSELDPESRAARRGLRPGDIIFGANGNRIRDLAEFEEVVSGVSGTLFMEGLRRGKQFRVRVD